MRQVKIIHKRVLENGVEEMEKLINEALKEINAKDGMIKDITYPSTDATGRVTSAVIQYDI